MRKRWHVIIDVMKDRLHIVGAEIGVWRGINAQRVLASLKGIKTYYCVDPWKLYQDHIDILRSQASELIYPHDKAFKDFKASVKPWRDKVQIIRAKSMDALKVVPDGYLDWVFIDANHSYEYTKPDIIGWSAKVKPGGVIFGHDFKDPRPGHSRKKAFGVERAVRELITNFKVDTNVWYTIK